MAEQSFRGGDGVSGGREVVAIETAALAVELKAPDWYAPARWTTRDGYMPVGAMWVRFQALRMHEAQQALAVARGIGVALSGEAGRAMAEQLTAEALPMETV